MKSTYTLFPFVSASADDPIAFLAAAFHMPSAEVLETLRLYDVEPTAVVEIVTAVQQQCAQQQERLVFNYSRTKSPEPAANSNESPLQRRKD